MQVVDNQAISVILIVRIISITVPRNMIFRGFFGPTEGNFIMQVVDNQAISVMLIVRIIPVPRNRIYRGFLGLLREIL
jgi:hypothetical protein